MKTKTSAGSKDAVDAILMQWARERPDLDPSPMGPIGRIKRCAALLDQSLDENFAQFGLTIWEFDVLASLRRAGEPFLLSPTALFSSLMVTSGTMTHRLKRLEGSGLIERVPNEHDARSMLVRLSEKGLELVNRAVEVHLERERSILKALPAVTLAELDAHLSTLLQSLEDRSDRPASFLQQ